MNAKNKHVIALESSVAVKPRQRKPNPHEQMAVREAVRAPKLLPFKGLLPNDGTGNKCRNGNCSRNTYRGRRCFRCWVGDKWTSLHQRAEGNYGACYIGVPFSITRSEFIRWTLNNPPPATMKWPSIDRIIAKKGYIWGNIQWLEFRDNCSKHAGKNDRRNWE